MDDLTKSRSPYPAGKLEELAGRTERMAKE